MKKIKFSVLVPVFNVEIYLKKCIDSILHQTYQDFEIILIDDGSTDSSGKICDNYAVKDKRIRVFHQQNQGQLISRRNAIEKSTGDFCLFLDSDDFWDNDLLENIFDTILKYNCDIVLFKYKRVLLKNTKCMDPVFQDKTIFDSNNKDILFKKIFSSSALNNLATKAVRRTIIKKNNYLQFKGVKHGEDLLESISMLYNARKIVYIDKALYNYRLNPDSVTNTFNVNKYKDINIVRNVILIYMKKMKLDTQENLIIFYQGYINSILNYISQLINSNLGKEEKNDILLDILKSELYNRALKYSNLFQLPVYRKYSFILLKYRYFKLLFFYEKFMQIFRVIKHHI